MPLLACPLLYLQHIAPWCHKVLSTHHSGNCSPIPTKNTKMDTRLLLEKIKSAVMDAVDEVATDVYINLLDNPSDDDDSTLVFLDEDNGFEASNTLEFAATEPGEVTATALLLGPDVESGQAIIYDFKFDLAKEVTDGVGRIDSREAAIKQCWALSHAANVMRSSTKSLIDKFDITAAELVGEPTHENPNAR